MDQQTTTATTIDEKAEKFKKLATQRGNRILKGLFQLSHLSNRSNYVYSERDFEMLLASIQEGVDDLANQFRSAMAPKKAKQLKLF